MKVMIVELPAPAVMLPLPFSVTPFVALNEGGAVDVYDPAGMKIGCRGGKGGLRCGQRRIDVAAVHEPIRREVHRGGPDGREVRIDRTGEDRVASMNVVSAMPAPRGWAAAPAARRPRRSP